MSVWMLPLPFFSHVICFSQLGVRLARHGVSVRIFLTKDDRDRLLDHPLYPRWSAEGLDIEIQVLEDCHSALMADTSGDAERFIATFFRAEDAFGAVLCRAKGEGSQPTGVIADHYFPRTAEAALELGMFACLFSLMSASYMAVTAYLQRSISTGLMTLPSNWSEKRAEEFVSLPGYELMKVYDLAEFLFSDHPYYDITTNVVVSVMQRVDAVLINSFRDLEPRGFASLQQSLNAAAARNSTGATPVWAVGPTFDVEAPYLTDSDNVDPCIQFLDSHPTSSVVFVAFGGDVNLPEEQIRELVYGLESTQHPFICVLHAPKMSAEADPNRDAKSVLPEDCLSRIANKSLFVKWAPQQQVLSHSSLGAFISHAGQNSLLEAVALGVPIIAWSCLYEQRMNSRFLVDVAQLSIEVSPGRLREGLVDRKEVERCVNHVLHSEEGAALRKRVQVMKEKAEAALGPQGNTTCNIQALVARIREHERGKGATGMPSSKVHINGVSNLPLTSDSP